MAFINWTDALSVQIESLDTQHKNLIEQINKFYTNYDQKATKERMETLIKAMKEYTVFHFQTEEQIMRQCDYPNYISHKAEHDKFIEKVSDYEQRYQSGKLLLSVEITNFIRDWVSTHIQGTDKKYSDFFIQNGIQ
jgi:hemerythrin